MSRKRQKKAQVRAKAQGIKGKRADLIIVDDIRPQEYSVPRPSVEVDPEAGWKVKGFTGWSKKWTREELERAEESARGLSFTREFMGEPPPTEGPFTREMVERALMTDAEVHTAAKRFGIPVEELVAVCEETGMAPAAAIREAAGETTMVIGGRRYGRSPVARAATALMGLGEAIGEMPPALRALAERMEKARKAAALMAEKDPFKGLTPEMLARTEPGPRIFAEGEIIHSAGYNFHVVEIDRDVFKNEFTFWAVIKDGQGLVQTKTPAHVDARTLEMLAGTGDFVGLRDKIIEAWTQEAQRYYAVEAAPSDFVDTLIEKVQEVWTKHFPDASEPVGDDEELDDGDGMGAADVRSLRQEIEGLLWPRD